MYASDASRAVLRGASIEFGNLILRLRPAFSSKEFCDCRWYHADESRLAYYLRTSTNGREGTRIELHGRPLRHAIGILILIARTSPSISV